MRALSAVGTGSCPTDERHCCFNAMIKIVLESAASAVRISHPAVTKARSRVCFSGTIVIRYRITGGSFYEKKRKKQGSKAERVHRHTCDNGAPCGNVYSA